MSQYVTGGELRRETVSNYVKESADAVLYDIPGKKRQGKILHVYMDEDHIALQHVPRKKHTTVPFGVVSEGLRKEGKDGSGRNRLINPKYFTGHCLGTKDPAAETAGYIAASCDTLFPEKVYVHGDAGGWIRTAPEDTTGECRVPDGFHLTREISRFAGHFPDDKKDVIKTLKAPLKKNDHAASDAETDRTAAGTADEKIQEKCRMFRTYFTRSRDAAVRRQDKISSEAV